MPARSSRAPPPSGFRAPRNIFRRCPNAAAVSRSIVANSAGSGCAGRGTRPTTAENTFGGGTKASGGMRSARSVAQIHCASTDSRP